MSYPLLKIKNFGPIKDIEIELRQFTIFIGPNSSGKSTICKVLASILNLNKHINIFIQSLLQGKISPKDADKFSKEKRIILENENIPKLFFEEYTIANYFNNKTEISLKFNNINFKLTKDKIEYPISDENELGFFLINFLYRSFKSIVDEEFKIKFSIQENILYIPAERGIFTKIKQDEYEMINLYQENNYYLLNYLHKFSTARKELKTIDVNELNLYYKYNDGANEEFRYKSSQSFPIQFASSGIRNILSMSILIEYVRSNSNYDTIIIEEPEISLFPDTQFNFIKYLINVKNTSKKINQIILSTHSTDVLSSFSLFAYAGYLFKKNPDLRNDISKLLNNKLLDNNINGLLINKEDLAAYRISHGKAEKLFIEEDNFFVVNDEELLEISNKTGEIINELYELANKK